ncbi:PulJ/GspJ family protein [Pontiella agarivorans]|uniref:Prepilin-type N-terminal cleavage/methylation domain-containing protein n=1 Tax=Pontiella agarivorans TaxID=3038953 RepID=A0ABU5MUK8_9BACT|nr:prepilin-type N-terminal cleavage/methylation domain-containing protein [Pontiella agarivorans]MDZ8117873.1 prepilin-type N-terminal cleavage/methylation domain-containing protein [Pontiella agarivorans]
MPPRSSRRGFTLLELMVSLVILSLVVLMISRIFTTSTSAVTRGGDDALLDEAARFVLDNLQTDISQALVRTNAPFRVDSVSVGDALYFVSTATRRQILGTPRDLAPVQIRSKQSLDLVSALNRCVVFEYIANVQTGTQTARKNLIRQSGYYNGTKPDFRSDREYTEELKDADGLTAQAVLTFMNFRINGNESNAPQPRFVDVIIGLSSARDMRQAMRIYATRGNDETEHFLATHEQVYTRRIYLPNLGTSLLEFE